MKCDHCDRDILDWHESWHRRGYHYCGWVCYRQDFGCVNKPDPVDKDEDNRRKKINP